MRMARYYSVMTQSSQQHLARLAELLAIEQRYEIEQHRRILTPEKLAGPVADSDCRYPVTVDANVDYNPLGQLVMTVRYEVNEDDADSDFEPGCAVEFFYHSNSDGVVTLPHVGHVSRSVPGCVEVVMAGTAAFRSVRDIAASRFIGMRLGIDNISYSVMTDAIASVRRADSDRLVALRETLAGDRQPQFAHRQFGGCPWLNPSQNAAIQKVLDARDVAIVHGPPGTGKTTTLVEAVIETLRRETQVLVCAPSNAAVDWISEQLSRRGVAVLRVGNPLRMSDSMLDCSFERRYAAHPDYPELWKIRRLLREGYERSGNSESTANRRRKLRERETELDMKIVQDLMEQSSVVSCTLIGSAYRLLERRHFSTLFIDEAAQALEPACWAAIAKADRVVFGGDHQQLPPTVKSPEASALSRTLMQRVAREKRQCVTLLDTQYRMNSAIMGFSSQWFYHGRLKAAPEVADRLVSPIDTPLTWLDTSELSDTSNDSEKRTRTGSLTNAQEARLLIRALRDYVDVVSMQKILNERVDFGIITPYRGQARLIRRLLKMQHFFRSLRRQITVGTVDGFQGQERDVIVISMVRDNNDGTIGFLHDLRRMNVAITRARMKLIVVGNIATLGRHRFYRELVEYCSEHGEIVTLRPFETQPSE